MFVVFFGGGWEGGSLFLKHQKHQKLQVAEGLNAMGQKQHLIEQMQLEIRSLVFQ